MVYASDVMEAKEKYGKVFSAEDEGIEYIFRALTKKEFDNIRLASETQSSVDLEEFTILIALIEPQDIDFDELSPGFVSSLAAEIIEASGFTDVRNFYGVFEESREKVEKLTSSVKAFIMAAIPTYSSDDIDNMSLFKMAETLALAEKIIEIRAANFLVESAPRIGPYQDPEEEKKQDPIAGKLSQALG